MKKVDGRFVVTWRRKRESFATEEEALKFLREKRAPADKVVKEEEDGYRTPLTRRRWRKGGTDL